MAKSEGAAVVRRDVNWDEVAPAVRPPGFVASDPASPGYDWTATDAIVRSLRSAGLPVLIDIGYAPAWAEGRGQPAGGVVGTWRPDPGALAAFAHAAAVRYSGRFPDPMHPGQSLPAVHYWQAWNEPNLGYHLAPQWMKRDGHQVAVSPDMYRQMLNAFYPAVKRVSASDVVLAAGTAPYGDDPGGDRMRPVAFERALFCLRDDASLRAIRCPSATHLDAIDQHLYPYLGPDWHATNPDDIAVPDVHRLVSVLHAAQNAGRVLPRGRKRVWVTEIQWDSRPPDPQGVPQAKHAQWLEEALYALWRQGVDTVLWWQLVDQPPVPDYASTYQGGLFDVRWRPKPAAAAFRFPFVVQRLKPGYVRVWAYPPVAGKLALQVHQHGQWAIVRRLAVRSHHVSLITLRLSSRPELRGQVGGITSLATTPTS